jgi:hypothetical protein
MIGPPRSVKRGGARASNPPPAGAVHVQFMSRKRSWSHPTKPLEWIKEAKMLKTFATLGLTAALVFAPLVAFADDMAPAAPAADATDAKPMKPMKHHMMKHKMMKHHMMKHHMMKKKKMMDEPKTDDAAPK